jgi:hypothetical protein
MMDFVQNRVLHGLLPGAEQIKRLSESLSMARAVSDLQRELSAFASVGDVIASANRMREGLRVWQENYRLRTEQMTREMARIESTLPLLAMPGLQPQLYGLGEQFAAMQRAMRPLIPLAPLRFSLPEFRMPMMLKRPMFDANAHLDEGKAVEDWPHERIGFLDRGGCPKR